ncbi:MAG: SDR family oxidoreductase [bacterium]|nr:SDR family oxidoreductase [bacterium]
MIEKNETYVVMGLLDMNSIAFYVGELIEELGGNVIYTMQNERMKRLFLERNMRHSDPEKLERLKVKYCDVTAEEEVERLFEDIGDISGVCHAIAYTNPKTGLGKEYHTNAFDDLKLGFHISSISLATVTQYAQKHMPKGGGVVSLSFDTSHQYAYYNWMSVNKAALEAVCRGLSRRHGRDKVRINIVSAGPVETRASSAIPGFREIKAIWEKNAPLSWNLIEDKKEVANAVVFLMGKYSKKITGQILHVDGGRKNIGGDLLDYEKN